MLRDKAIVVPFISPATSSPGSLEDPRSVLAGGPRAGEGACGGATGAPARSRWSGCDRRLDRVHSKAMSALESLLEQALQLPDCERGKLAMRLLGTLEPDA